MERGREERKNLSSTSWGENVRQTVFVEMQVKEALHLLQITSWQRKPPKCVLSATAPVQMCLSHQFVSKKWRVEANLWKIAAFERRACKVGSSNALV